MNPASKDITTLLQGESDLGLTFGTDLFFSRMPDSPDDCVAVFDNPGSPPMLTYQPLVNNYFYSSVTIWVRDVDYALGWTKLHGIINYLHGLGNLDVGTTHYSLIKALGDPMLLHWDENERAVLIVNFTMHRRNK